MTNSDGDNAYLFWTETSSDSGSKTSVFIDTFTVVLFNELHSQRLMFSHIWWLYYKMFD